MTRRQRIGLRRFFAGMSFGAVLGAIPMWALIDFNHARVVLIFAMLFLFIAVAVSPTRKERSSS